MSTVYKLYSTILNERIMLYLETERLLVEEQNGFHKSGSCLDHILELSTIITNRISENKSTSACFIDFQMAFDMISREF